MASRLKDALVEFKIYNYAEFNSVAARRRTRMANAHYPPEKGYVGMGQQGRQVRLQQGLFRQRRRGYDRLEQETGRCGDDRPRYHTTGGRLYPSGSYTGAKGGERKRLLEEDAIRNKYVATFYTEEKAEALAKRIGYRPDEDRGFHDR